MVQGLVTGVTAVAAAIEHTCAIVNDGLKCWGQAGTLGDGTLTARPAPVDVFGIASGATSIGTGAAVSCATVSGAVTCWGISNQDILGDPPKTTALKPNPVPTLSTGATSTGVGDHACAIVGGGVRCWGQYPGNGTATSPVATGVSGAPGSSASVLAVGQKHACAIAGGAVWCWGSNNSDQLGVAGIAEALSPVAVGN